MRSDTSRGPLSQQGGQWLLALMVIAATAVIVVSLFALARMTGVIPQAGIGQHEAETAREKSRKTPNERDDASPQHQRPSPGTQPGARPLRPIAQHPDCSVACSPFAQVSAESAWTLSQTIPARIAS